MRFLKKTILFIAWVPHFAALTSMAASSSSVEHFVHQEIESCIDRFHETVEQNVISIQSDVKRSEQVRKSIARELDQKWLVMKWIEQAIDRISQNEWDWEHPSKPITLVGKYRAYGVRVKIMKHQEQVLKEFLKMDALIHSKLSRIFLKMNSSSQEWAAQWGGVRSMLRKRELEYYDFMGDQARQQVHERGFVDVFSWNKTMGAIQENFYRNISCVTVLDQLQYLIPKTIKPNRSFRLVDENSAGMKRRI